MANQRERPSEGEPHEQQTPSRTEENGKHEGTNASVSPATGPLRTAVLSVAEKRELLKNLLGLRAADSTGAVPLSYGQQALWFVYQLAPTSPAYNFLYAARIRSALAVPIFLKACQILVQRHPTLGARFVLQNGKPTQVFDSQPTVAVPVHDASDWSAPRLLETLRQRADEPFDLERGPMLRIELFRRGPAEVVLLFVFHHIIADLWSMDLLLGELQKIYAALSAGQAPDLPALPAQFADYVRWQMLAVHGPSGDKSWGYWQRLLAGELPVLNLPTDRPRPAVQTFNGTAHTWALQLPLVQRLRALAQAQQATPYAALLAVFQLLLQRLSGQDDILVGSAVADRRRPEAERLVGYLLNQVVFRADFTAEVSFRTLLERTRDQVLAALDHQDFPFGLLVKRLQPRRDGSRSPIFQVMFVWDKPHTLNTPWGAGPAATSNGAALPLETMLMEQRGAPFDLTLIIFELGDGLTASFRYNSDLFDAATITRLAGYFDTLLESLVDAPDRLVGEAPLLPAAERQQLLVDWNRTTGPCPANHCFHQLFERQAAQAPEARALEFEDQSFSYAGLNARANQLARHLQGLGVRRGDTVAISLPRGPDLIIAVLAAWKAGAAYLYLDPAYPARRLAAMVSDAQAAVLVAAESHPDLHLPTVRLGHDLPLIAKLDAANLNLPVGPEDRAYLIYTSGSTGQPKGTILRHGGLANMVAAQQHVFRVEPGDRCLQLASFSFDASVFETTMALHAGACLVVATAAAALSGPELARFLRDKAITNATVSPSVLAAVPVEPLPALRVLIVAGEACSADLVARWAPGRRFYNAYGPTEATVWCTVAECFAGAPPTIGRPILNTRAYVLDRNLQPVPVGVTGELYVAGPGLAEGYLNQPELTAERFLPNPFDEGDGAAMYRTGDLVRWTARGVLEFLGRHDQQIKLRGYRIELEEIQEVLRSHTDVADAVVTARCDAGCSLAAYVVPRRRESFSIQDVRAYCRERLPHYMLPAAIVTLDALPLTVSGKVDRARLPAPSAEPTRNRQLTPPRTATETLLASIWAQVLNLPQVGIHDNFFDLGGASIQTLEIVTQARARGLVLSPEMLFRYQTVAELAAACGPGQPSNGPLAAPSEPAACTHVESSAAIPADAKPVALPGALIESIGVYLPPRAVTTDDVLKQCRTKLDFHLERLTGIHSRRMAGETEFSIDLAEKAVSDCLARSKYRPEDIELLICCNISRYDGPNYRVSFEPTSAARLCRRFGLVNAVGFDITNACAGTFTALNVVDALMRHGVVRRALVVSGEYITHLTNVAQREIENFMDARMACLTLGDSGLALTVERAPSPAVGFQDIEVYTLGKYHDLCVAKVTTKPPGGAIMHTDAIKASAVSIKQIVRHALERLQHNQWPPETVNALVMHQTSETTLDGAVREINRAFGRPVCHRGNTLYNIAERGNTATTTHFLAIWERMRAGEIQPGNRAVFGISGSGQTAGTALYTFDDLPSRIRVPAAKVSGTLSPAVATCHVENGSAGERVPDTFAAQAQYYRCARPVRIESIGMSETPVAQPADTVTLLRQAGEDCLRRSARPREEIDLVLHTGVYRTDFLSEPALAAIAAGELRINHDEEQAASRRTLAFDLMNGAAGTLTGCFLASQLIAARKFSRALILASEIENNAVSWPENLLGLKETASGLILEENTGPEGFTAFGFQLFPEYLESIVSHTGGHNNRPVLFHRRDAALESHQLECARSAVTAFLTRHGVSLGDVAMILPSQRSRRFRAALADALSVPVDRLLALEDDGDYYTSSLAYSFARARQDGRLTPGTQVLIVEVAAGLQVCCALYAV
jgi:amino acid adenylation domain-containing protein